MTGIAMARLFLVIDALGWAAVLAEPGRTFALSHSYDLMASIMTEEHWTVFFAVQGIVMATCFWWRPPLPRLLISIAVGIVHLLLAYSFAWGSGMLSTGSITHFDISITLAFWLVGQEMMAWRRG